MVIAYVYKQSYLFIQVKWSKMSFMLYTVQGALWKIVKLLKYIKLTRVLMYYTKKNNKIN